MIFKDISFAHPLENILYDEVLFALAEKECHDDILRLWESSQTFIVLGRTGCLEEEIHSVAVQRDHVPVLRRCSGGGTVVQGPGCLNFSFVFSKGRHPSMNDLRRSYQEILGRVLRVMERVGVVAAFRPISDLAALPGELKFSGNAQRRGRNVILHHGTILYAFDLKQVSRYLKMPRSVPAYRAGRTHEEFLTNVRVAAPVLREAFLRVFPITEVTPVPDDEERRLLDVFLRQRSDDNEGLRTDQSLAQGPSPQM